MSWRLVAATGGAAMFEVTGHPLITLPLVHEVLPALPLGLCTCASSYTVHTPCTHRAYTVHTYNAFHGLPFTWAAALHESESAPCAAAMRGGSDVASSAADTRRRLGAQPARRSVTARACLQAAAGGGGGDW